MYSEHCLTKREKLTKSNKEIHAGKANEPGHSRTAGWWMDRCFPLGSPGPKEERSIKHALKASPCGQLRVGCCASPH